MSEPSAPSAPASQQVLTLMAQAVAAQTQGQLAQAEALYKAVLRLQPRHADALNMLGTLAAVSGRMDQAVELMTQAVDCAPGNAQALHNLGVTYRNLQRPADALPCFERAVAAQPDYLEAWNNLGLTQADLALHAQALVSYGRALALQPAFAVARFNSGLACKALDQPADALACFDAVLQQHPTHAESWNQRADVLRILGRYDEAIASCDKAIALAPGLYEAHHTRGGALFAQRKFKQALAAYGQTAKLKPDFALAHFNVGNALLCLGHAVEALQSYDKALALDDSLVLAHERRGLLLRKFKRLSEAREAFARVLSLAPEHRYALGSLADAQAQVCDWPGLANTKARLAEALAGPALPVMPLNLLALCDDPQRQLDYARRFAAAEYPLQAKPVWRGEVYGHDKIRVAYLSADFKRHPVSFLMAGLFERHDRSRFEVIALSFGADVRDPMRERLKLAFDQFIDVHPQTDQAVAQRLRDMEVDIVVDLMGFTDQARTDIFALRAAPVQVSYLGYPGTMGADYMDYLIGDPVLMPEGADAWYTEKLVRLPESYMVNDDKRPIAAHTPDRSALGLPAHGFVFCAFNNAYKLGPDLFAVWMRLLQQVQGSVLWLLDDHSDTVAYLRREAAAHGVAPERLVFAPRVPLLEDHLARQRQADLFLDTLPYNAHTTASDALWAGLPVLTCLGQTFAGRVAASLLTAAGLPELITPDLPAYEALALKLATQPDQLTALRARLAANRDSCPLFDTDRFRQHLEQAYTTMVTRQRQGLAPVSFSVPALPR